MSKIICEVCGTSYPEVSTQCPICGCVRPADAQSISDEAMDTQPKGTYQHVKGGRFSKANVRKRNAGAAAAAASEDVPVNKSKKKSGNTGLIITIIVLLLAIIAVAAYIVVNFFLPSGNDTAADRITTGLNPAEASEDARIACQNIALENSEIQLTEVGAQAMLTVTAEPADTTDTVVFTCDNEAVATIREDGYIKAVGFGEAVITVTCGDAQAQCHISVAEAFALDTDSITLKAADASAQIYSGNIAPESIQWETDDALVATIAEGVVTAVGAGETTVHGTYNGETLSCTVACFFDESAQTTDATQSSASGSTAGQYTLKNLFGGSNSDVTLQVGESFILALYDDSGNKISDAVWSVEAGTSCTVSNGTVTAVSTGYSEVIATYNGERFVCIVRVP